MMVALEDENGAPLCSDCRVHAELYMVRDEVWPNVDGWLCIPCLERRCFECVRMAAGTHSCLLVPEAVASDWDVTRQ
jgi:hypothetical protein